jgi:UDP-glucose 4-epimerase
MESKEYCHEVNKYPQGRLLRGGILKIFLTGSTGFIGSNLVKTISKEHDVVCLIPSSELGMRPIPENVRIEFSDLGNFDHVRELILEHKPEVIMHLGAATPVRYSFTFPDIYEKINHLGTKNLVDAAMKLPDFKMFMLASSAETYGVQEKHEPFPESTKQNAASPYAISKIRAEEYVKKVGLSDGFPHLIFRFTTTFGRDNETGYVIEYAITQMLKGKPVNIGTPDSVRDFMYVEDHIQAYHKGMEFNPGYKSEIISKMKEDPNAFVFNVGPGNGNKVIDVISKIIDIVGFKGEITTGFPKNYPKRTQAETYLVVNPSKANEILKWKPEYSLEEGLKKAVEVWKNQF